MLATATIFPNRSDDYLGCSTLTETRDLRTPQNVAKWEVSKSTNVYTLPDDHLASVLRTQPASIDKWITSDKESSNSGVYLKSLFRKVCECRTYASVTPRFPKPSLVTSLPNSARGSWSSDLQSRSRLCTRKSPLWLG